jgi:hypothetical protein
MKKKIYIAGKVTGLSKPDCIMNFGTAQIAIEKLNYIAVNPLEVVNDWECTWELAMRKCITALMQCDAVLALDNCNQSEGATIELQLAHKLRMPIFYETEHFTNFAIVKQMTL